MTGKITEHTGEQRRRLLYARLITLMQLADESAEIAYPRRLHMPNLNRQLIFMIGMFGQAAAKDLATASGREKAQISRGVKALDEAGLIVRHGPRGPLSLSSSGQAIHAEIVQIARERDGLLRKGLGEAETARFLAMTGVLIDRASSIYLADENFGAIDFERRSLLHHPPEGAGAPSYRDLLLPWMQSLFTYMRRSGTSLFRREVDLSTFEWIVLSLVAENQPINLSSLIVQVARDKSQVARVIKQLHATGLIDRRDEGRVNAALILTEQGRARYDRIAAITVERDASLFSGELADGREFYMDTLDRLTDNAEAMLDVERTSRAEKEAPAPHRRSRADDDEVAALRAENARLKQLLAEAILENAVLREGGPAGG